mmetsp:Transcript_37361/g.103114  ORF Transcript_37361/g.103114 Transcript_37361/m.103114 type:complete len:235 (+) Transcript_37361:173-877(+)
MRATRLAVLPALAPMRRHAATCLAMPSAAAAPSRPRAPPAPRCSSFALGPTTRALSPSVMYATQPGMHGWGGQPMVLRGWPAAPVQRSAFGMRVIRAASGCWRVVAGDGMAPPSECWARSCSASGDGGLLRAGCATDRAPKAEGPPGVFGGPEDERERESERGRERERATERATESDRERESARECESESERESERAIERGSVNRESESSSSSRETIGGRATTHSAALTSQVGV